MANYHLCARDIMQTEVATVLPEFTVQDAAALMRNQGVRSLVVEKDTDDDAYGLITYADIVTKVLAQGFDPLDHELQAVAPPFCPCDGRLDILESVGVIELGAQIFDKRMYFRVDQKHLAAESRGQEKLLVESSVVDE